MISSSFVLLAVAGIAMAAYPVLDGNALGGKLASSRSIPYQLSVHHFNSHCCGASILSARWALTSASCVKDLSASDVSFRAGSNNKGSGGIIYQVQKIVLHFNYKDLDWDYALVKTVENMAIGTGTIYAVKLASSEAKPGTPGIVSGWGKSACSPILKTVNVKVIEHNNCDQVYGNITERMICAQDTEGTCQGETGDPLINKYTNEQVGILSWGHGCESPEDPGVYSNIPVVRGWIKEITGI